jgi:hypothetical protein
MDTTVKVLTRLVRSVGVLTLLPGVNNSEYITLSLTLKGGKNAILSGLFVVVFPFEKRYSPTIRNSLPIRALGSKGLCLPHTQRLLHRS